MTDLERQCEEIRNSDNRRVLADLRQRLPQLEPQYFELLGTVTAVAAQVDTLLEYIAELRRPSDAKEIAEIQERYASDLRALQYDPEVNKELNCWQDVANIGTLLHALAESQRDNAKWINARDCWQAEQKVWIERAVNEQKRAESAEEIVAVLKSAISQVVDSEPSETQLEGYVIWLHRLLRDALDSPLPADRREPSGYCSAHRDNYPPDCPQCFPPIPTESDPYHERAARDGDYD